MGLNDQQIYQKLNDPVKFRAAFPEYAQMADGDIKTGLARFAPKYASSPTPPGGFAGGTVGGQNVPQMTQQQMEERDQQIINSGKGANSGTTPSEGSEGYIPQGTGKSVSAFNPPKLSKLQMMGIGLKNEKDVEEYVRRSKNMWRDSVFAYGARSEHSPYLGTEAGKEKILGDPGQLADYGTRERGALSEIGNLATVGNATTAGTIAVATALTAGLAPMAATTLSRLVAGGFTLQMAKGLYNTNKEYHDAVEKGDEAKAKEIQGKAAVDIPLTLLSAYGMLKAPKFKLGETEFERTRSSQYTQPDIPVKTAPHRVEALSSLLDSRGNKVDTFEKAGSTIDAVRNEAAKQGITENDFSGREGNRLGLQLVDDAAASHDLEVDNISRGYLQDKVDMSPIAKAYKSVITDELRKNEPEVAQKVEDQANKFNKAGELQEVNDFRERINKERNSFYKKSEAQKAVTDVEDRAEIAAVRAARKLQYEYVGNKAGVDPAYIKDLMDREGHLIDVRNDLDKIVKGTSKSQSNAVSQTFKEKLFGTKGKPEISDLKTGFWKMMLGMKPVDILNARLKTIFGDLQAPRAFNRPTSAPGGVPPVGPNRLALPPVRGPYEMPASSVPEPKGLPPASLPTQENIPLHQPPIEQPMQVVPAKPISGRNVKTGQFKKFFGTSPQEALKDIPIVQFPGILQRAINAIKETPTSPTQQRAIIQDLQRAMEQAKPKSNVAAVASKTNSPEMVQQLSEEAAQRLFNKPYNQLDGMQRIQAIREATSKQTEMRASAGENTSAFADPEMAKNVPPEIQQAMDRSKTLGAKPRGMGKKKVNKQSGFASMDIPGAFAEGAGKMADVFYSKLKKTVEEKMSGTMPAEAVLATLKNAGISKDEMQYSGIQDFLQDKTKVTKQEVLDHLQQNGLKVNETVLGGHVATYDDIQKARQWVTNASATDLAGQREMLQDIEKAADGDMNAVGNLETSGMPEELVDRFRNFAGRGKGTKFSDPSHQLPGGTNYKEMLMTLPEREVSIANQAKWDKYTRLINEQRKIADDVNRPWHEVEDANRKINQFYAQRDVYKENNTNFTSGHYSDIEPNVMAHTRFNDRVDADGKKMLFMEEAQSDWHQKGRKEGYEGGVSVQQRQAAYEKSLAAQNKMNDFMDANGIGHGKGTKWSDIPQSVKDEYSRLADERDAAGKEYDKVRAIKGVPDAPFKKDWHELVMKRMIRYAAENGYDRLGWTTGAQQAERYDLSKQISKVEATKTLQGQYALTATDHSGRRVLDDVFPAEKLPDVVGKELAEKIVNEVKAEPTEGQRHNKTYSGLDLKVGGKGMEGFYDKILPDFMNKYGKKWGAKVGQSEIPQSHDASLNDRFESKDKARDIFDRGGEVYGVDKHGHEVLIEDKDEINDMKAFVLGDKQPGTKVHSIDITPAMKHEVLKKGQPISEQRMPTSIPPKIRELMGESA